MSKIKKPKKLPKILIPFKYEDDSFMSETSYKEGDSSKQLWDTVDKNWVRTHFWKPNMPEKEIFDYSNNNYNYYSPRKKTPNPDYEKQMKEYDLKVLEYEGKIKEINDRKISGRYIEVNNIIWKDNVEFKDTFCVDTFSGKGASKYIILVSQTTGQKYNIFLKNLVHMLQNVDVINGIVTGTWTYSKLRNNYGVALVSP